MLAPELKKLKGKKMFRRILKMLIGLTLGVTIATPVAAINPVEVRQHYDRNLYFGGWVAGSFLVYQQGEITYEFHRSGHGYNTPQVVNSVTKTVLAMLVGIAIQRGHIANVDVPVYRFFPEVEITDERKQDMTVRHLLTMTSGLPTSFVPLMAENAALAAFEMPLRSAPGEQFRYCSGAGTQTLVGVLQRAIGAVDLFEFAQTNLFEPLALSEHIHWQTARDGSLLGGMGMHMTPADMLRLGQLYLYDGVWQGRRILPPGWLEYGWPNIPVSTPGINNIGFMLRGSENSFGRFAAAQGVGGNVISIYPDAGMVVVRMGNHLLAVPAMDRAMNVLLR